MSRAEKPPLLEVRDLTLRFRGLTAVSHVNLTVNEGEIAAVIGPNGAGKTSLFNAITGIYEPTSGTVRLGGRDVRAERSLKTVFRWLLAGITVGLLLLVAASDVNGLWSAVVRSSAGSDGAGFDWARTTRELASYLAARPYIEQRAGRFYVTTQAGDAPFGSSKTRDAAEQKRESLAELARAPRDGSTVVERDGAFTILSADGGRLLDTAPSREAALARLEAADAVLGDATTAIRWRAVVFLFGLLLGTAGAAAVWQQTRRTPASVAARGVARTFQNIRLFQEMSVLENVLVGMDRHLRRSGLRRLLRQPVDLLPPLALGLVYGFTWAALRFGFLPESVSGALWLLVGAGSIAYLVLLARRGAFTRPGAASERDGRTQARTLLEFVGLAERAEDTAKNLPYGAQRRLEIARALATEPRLLLLDEPAAGMNPSETQDLMVLIQAIRERGTTVLLIEHHMRVVMGVSDHITVLVHGEKLAEGTPSEVRENPRVVEAYLGSEELG